MGQRNKKVKILADPEWQQGSTWIKTLDESKEVNRQSVNDAEDKHHKNIEGSSVKYRVSS